MNTPSTRVYLDCNATAPLRPQARAAMLASLEAPANASSVHAEGRKARATIEAARRTVADAIGAAPDDVVFTSGGTEASALALLGTVQAAAERGQRFTRLLVSAVEHDCVRNTAQRCAELNPGLRLSEVPVDGNGAVDPEALGRQLAEGKGRALVSVMAVNNETGVIQPLERIAALCKAHGALFHADAVQAPGRMALSFAEPGPDVLTFSAHKFGGPQGAGFLVKRASVALAPLWQGGRQEQGWRPGTEPVAAIAGAAAAFAATQTTPLPNMAARLEPRLRAACAEAVIVGAGAPRVGNTTCVAVPGVPADALVIALDLDGFAVSAGSACSSGRVTRSHVLDAMGLDPDLAGCAIRISAGWQTTDADIDAFADAWTTIVGRARARAAA